MMKIEKMASNFIVKLHVNLERDRETIRIKFR